MKIFSTASLSLRVMVDDKARAGDAVCEEMMRAVKKCCRKLNVCALGLDKGTGCRGRETNQVAVRNRLSDRSGSP